MVESKGMKLMKVSSGLALGPLVFRATWSKTREIHHIRKEIRAWMPQMAQISGKGSWGGLFKCSRMVGPMRPPICDASSYTCKTHLHFLLRSIMHRTSPLSRSITFKLRPGVSFHVEVLGTLLGTAFGLIICSSEERL